MTKLEELIKIIGDESVYIQTHNYPDQDALASAYGLKCLLEAKGIEATICYKGQVDKLNTIAMMEDLNIAIVYIDDDDFEDVEEYDIEDLEDLEDFEYEDDGEDDEDRA